MNEKIAISIITIFIFSVSGLLVFSGLIGKDGLSQYNQRVERENAIRKEYVYQCVKAGRSSDDCHTLCDTECYLEELK